jgi:hypothetical protein
MFVTGSIRTGFQVTVAFKQDGIIDMRRRSRVYPLEQAMELFEDALARHVRQWRRRYTKERFPPLAKYHDYEPGDYQLPRAFPDYPRWANQNQKRFVDISKLNAKHITEEKSIYEYGYIDSGSDTFGIGGKCWVIDTLTDRKVEIAGYDNKATVKSNIPIGSAITAVDLPTGETILLRANEATIMGEDANTFFSVTQMREHGVEVHDIAKRHGSLSCL